MIVLLAAFWLLVCWHLYKRLFGFLLLDAAKSKPIEKVVVAMLACLIGYTLFFLINHLILLWKNQ